MPDIRPLEVLWRDAAQSGPQTPLVVLFHGGGQHERAMAAVADHIPATFAVASLRGPRPEGSGFAWYARDEREDRPDPASFEHAVAAIAATIESFDERRYDTRRLALVGFSSGASVAAGYAFAQTWRVKALALLSGLLPRVAAVPLQPGRLSGVDVFVGRGTGDTLLRPELVQRTEKYLWRQSGATAVEYTYPFGHVIEENELDDLRVWLLACYRALSAA